jgi:hypothetical protein
MSKEKFIKSYIENSKIRLRFSKEAIKDSS